MKKSVKPLWGVPYVYAYEGYHCYVSDPCDVSPDVNLPVSCSGTLECIDSVGRYVFCDGTYHYCATP